MNESYNVIIREARKKQRLKSKDVAEIVGVSTIYFSRIENRKGKPSLKLLKEICKTLNLDFGEIAKNEGYSENAINKTINSLSDKAPTKRIDWLLSRLSNQDCELVEDLIKRLPYLTDKEKDTIKFIISYKNNASD